MKITTAPLFLLTLGALSACAAPGMGRRAALEPDLVGQNLAQRQCGECHAVGAEGASPLADAPPFVVLRGRISRGDLALILERRMLEGHPRMPMFKADEAETARLLDYWDGLARPAA